MPPLCIDLCCGLGGWTKGFLAEGYEVIGFDIERHDYGTGGYPAQLVLQDILTLDGAQFKDAAVIVASPPCQRYSYMAMPWSRAKREASWQRWHRDSPFSDGFHLNDLFNACFRIQREASEAAGHHIPMVVENVKGAQPWIGRASWHFGSYYLWGDIPALMPFTAVKRIHDGLKLPGNNSAIRWEDRPVQRLKDATKNAGGSWFAKAHNTGSGHSQNPVTGEGSKVPGISFNGYGKPGYKPQGFNVMAAQRYREQNGTNQGGEWWHDPNSMSRRKAASAEIAQIPFPLSNWIAQCFKPVQSSALAS